MRTHFVRALVFLSILGMLAAVSCVVKTKPGHSKHPSTHERDHGKHKKAKKHKKHKKARKHKKHRKHR